MKEGRSWVYEPRLSKIGSSKEIVRECKYFSNNFGNTLCESAGKTKGNDRSFIASYRRPWHNHVLLSVKKAVSTCPGCF